MARKSKSRKNNGRQSVITAVSVSLLGCGSAAVAGPTGGVVVGGNATIDTSALNSTVINQSSAKAVINWNDFSISAGELVRFVQSHGNQAVTLNRVVSDQMSNIQGALVADGNIFLINPNGILFGANATVDVAGLLATTLDVNPDAFMNGDSLSFDSVIGKTHASVENRGRLQVGDGGFVYLVAPKVDNSGHIIANVGRVTMAAGDRFNVDLSGSGLVNFNVSADALGSAATELQRTGVNNRGKITAQSVLLAGNEASGLMSSVVNNSGVIEATSLDISAAGIALSAGTGIGDNQGRIVAGEATLTATDTLTTQAGSSLRAGTLNLETTAEGASIGQEGNALRVDADVLNARANNGHVIITDVAGGVALGEISTGNKDADHQRRVILRSEGGSLTSADPSKVNVTGWAANLEADGAIGSAVHGITTNIDVLSASTQNGGIHIEDQQGELLVGTVTARESVMINGAPNAVAAMSNAEGNIVLTNGSAGTMDVTLRSKGDMFLSGSVSTGNGLTLSSEQGSLYNAGDASRLVGKTINLDAGKGIALADRPMQVESEILNAQARDGGVHLREGMGVAVGSVIASGTDNDVSITAEQGDIRLGSVVADGGTVSVTSSNGFILDDNGNALNVRAEELTMRANNAIGTSANSIETSVGKITAETLTGSAGLYLSNNRALSSLNAATVGGDARVDVPGGQFFFNRSNSQLSFSGPGGLDLWFANNGGSIVVQAMNLGADKSLSLSSLNNITQGGPGALVAQDVTLTAGGNIGALGSALRTGTQNLVMTSRTGTINVDNLNAGPLRLTASANGTQGAVTLKQHGDLIVDSVMAKAAVDLSAGGLLLAGSTPSGVNVTAGSMKLEGAAIGADGQPFVSSVAGPVTLSSQGDIHLANTGAISLLNATAGGRMLVSNSGDVGVGRLEAGQSIKFDISGAASDANGGGINFIASGLEVASRAFGTKDEALELHVQSLTIDTVSGGIYATNLGGQPLALVRATTGGTGSDIRIENAGDIGLGVVNASGNNVVLSSGGAIEDARAPGVSAPNVSARSLDISGAGGVGMQGDLSLDVSFLSAAGGSTGVKAANAGAIAVDSTSLSGKGHSEISIIATDITVLNGNGGTITMEGGRLTMTATTGNIVFLNQNDTIYLPGGGSITLTAMGKSELDGYNGAIVAGNLRTDGGDIRLQAESNITIGMLDAGNAGNVSVLSRNGVIIDGNGSRENIRGNIVTLEASTPTRRDAELSRDTAIADFSAKGAEANAKQFDLGILIQQLQAYENQLSNALSQKQQAALSEWIIQRDTDSLESRVNTAQNVVDGLNTALKALSLVRNAAEFVSGAAQAIPFSGDGGTGAVAASLNVAVSVAELALDSYERYSLGPMASDLDALYNMLDVAKALHGDANTNLNMAQVLRDTVMTSKQMADLAVFKANTARDASEQIRRQAVYAYDLNKDIDSSAAKPLGISANQLNVNSNGTLNTSLYLETQGHLGLGNITVAVGQEIIAKAAQDLNVVGTVSSDTFIGLQAGGAIQGAGGSLVTPDLQLRAGQGIGTQQAVQTQVDRLAAAAGHGGVNIVNRNQGAALTVAALGDVQGVSGAGHIRLDTDGSLVLNQLVKDTSALHTVTLNSGDDIVDGNGQERNVEAARLVVNAKGNVELDTEVAELEARISGKGDFTLREASDLLARDVSLSDGDLVIDAAGHLTVGSLTADAVSLTAGGRIDDDQDNATLIVADKLALKSLQSIGATGAYGQRALDTQVNSLTALASGEINIAEQDDLKVIRVETDHGNVTLSSAQGSLDIDSVSTGADTISVIAAQGINNVREDEAANLTAANLAMRAGTGIGAGKALNVSVQNLEAEGGNGGVRVTDLDGDLRIGGVTPNLGAPALHGVRATAGDIEVRTREGALSVAEAVVNEGSGNIVLGAAGAITLDQAVIGQANIAVTAGGDLQQNANLLTEAGDIRVAAGGQLSMAAATLTSVTDTGDVSYLAGGDLQVSQIEAARGEVQLGATGGAISGHGNGAQHVVGQSLMATAASGIGSMVSVLKTRVDSIIATLTGAGDIHIAEADSVRLAQVSNAKGSVAIHAAGDLTAESVQATAVELVSSGNLVTADGGLIQADDLEVRAVNGVDIRTRANSVTASVTGTGDLRISETGAATLAALSTADGNIHVDAAGRLAVDSVQAATGTVTLNSGDAIVSQRSATTPADAIVGSRITLTAAAGIGNGEGGALDVAADRLTAISGNGDVRLSQSKAVMLDTLVASNGNLDVRVLQGNATLGTVEAGGDASLRVNEGALLDDGDAGTRIAARHLELFAADGVGHPGAALQTRAATLTAQVSRQGDIVIDELDGLASLTASTAAGNVSLRSASGDIGVNRVEAAGHGVSLLAETGAIRDALSGTANNITADRLVVKAAQGIGLPSNALDVTVGSLAASGGKGGVYINSLSADTLSLDSVDGGAALEATGGNILLTTAGALEVADAVRNSGGGNVRLDAGGSISQESDIVATGAGNVALRSGDRIIMGDAKTTTGSGNISYQAKTSLAISEIETNNKVGGGRVTFIAPQIIDNMPGVANVKGWVVDLDSRSASTPLIRELLGETADAALVRLDYRPIGGNLAESRRFMEALFRPAQGLSAAVVGAGPLTGRDMVTGPAFAENADGEMVYNKR
ncbi:two-partner secretion domain-containing protein [Stutzerimonas tarimensis]|uniref:Filamentous hemagglutinin N-terminal domain-containing protein n=1 Tax=Stutzerimonas tarimensis TaxID=1507735 RepID=A0ABV7T6H8_9GAMM